jgi:large subunit ribosomal protein L3
MALGMMGRKCGMTRIFTEEGVSVPVTVIELTPNRITQLKTEETKDKYCAVQMTWGTRSRNRLTKPMEGHFTKAGVEPGRRVGEFRMTAEEMKGLEVGGEITVDLFKDVKKVDVTGTSKGKGFAGTIKRHNFRGQDNTHGNSLSHRVPGSIGQNQTPGRVFKGKKMAGQLGNVRSTVQSLEVVRIDNERHLLLVKGAVPGATDGQVIVRPAVKVKKTTDG